MTKNRWISTNQICATETFSRFFSCYVHPFLPAQTGYLLRHRSPWGSSSQFKWGEDMTNFKMIVIFFAPFSSFFERFCFLTLISFLGKGSGIVFFPSTVRINLISVLLWGCIAAKSAAKSGLFRFLVDVSRLLTSSMKIPVSLSCWNKFGDPNRRQYKTASIFFLSPAGISNSLSIPQG